MLGLHSAGKTTYAVVFYTACEGGRDGMAITKYAEGDRAYLNERADELANCKPLERTSQQARGELRLRVKLGSNRPERLLVMPDLSGELLRDSMTDRLLNEDLSQLMDESDAALLFVHSNRIIQPTNIADLNELLRRAGEQPGGETARETPDDWEIDLAATQVQLTDIMQELMRLRGARPLRLGLILSAWDTQEEEGLSPGAWASEYLPLLVQMLESDPRVDWDVFGVSAQGGDFFGPERADLEDTDVAERPKVQRRDGQSAGIGAPLLWALEPQ